MIPVFSSVSLVYILIYILQNFRFFTGERLDVSMRLKCNGRFGREREKLGVKGEDGRSSEGRAREYENLKAQEHDK